MSLKAQVHMSAIEAHNLLAGLLTVFCLCTAQPVGEAAALHRYIYAMLDTQCNVSLRISICGTVGY